MTREEDLLDIVDTAQLIIKLATRIALSGRVGADLSQTLSRRAADLAKSAESLAAKQDAP